METSRDKRSAAGHRLNRRSWPRSTNDPDAQRTSAWLKACSWRHLATRPVRPDRSLGVPGPRARSGASSSSACWARRGGSPRRRRTTSPHWFRDVRQGRRSEVTADRGQLVRQLVAGQLGPGVQDLPVSLDRPPEDACVGLANADQPELECGAPPPRSVQKSSSSCLRSARTSRPSAVTSSIAWTWLAASPWLRPNQLRPPPRV